MVAARIATLEHGSNQHRSGQLAAAPTQEQAAGMLNVGERSVRRAREVLEDGVPEPVAKVERGRVSVSAAADVARLPKPEQREIVARGEKAVVDAARDIRTNGMAHRTNFTGNNEWFTPEKYIELARDVLGDIDLDPIDGLVIASNGFLSRSKIYEEIAAGRLKARKFGTRTGILDNDFRNWLATLPEMNPTKTGGAK